MDSVSGKWIREFREKYGLTREELAKIITVRTGKFVSKVLIGKLEYGDVTHPRIAARIAKVLGAGAAEFDGIVPKKYGGMYDAYADGGSAAITAAEIRAVVKHAQKGQKPKAKPDRGIELRDCREIGVQNPTDVLVIDSNGDIIGEYLSASAAATVYGDIDMREIVRHCTSKNRDNFSKRGHAYRYRKDFSDWERRRMIETARRQLTIVTDFSDVRAYSLIEIDGEVKMLKEWTKLYQVNYKKAKARMRAGWDPRDALEMEVLHG